MSTKMKRTIYRTIKTISEQTMFERIITLVAIVIVFWLVGSYVEVITHNLNQVSDYTYSPFNAFSILLNLHTSAI